MPGKEDGAVTPPWVDALVQVSFAVQDALSRAAADHDLSVTQLRLLGVLRDRTPAMAVIAHHLGLDPSSVSGLIDRAERRGLVRRSTSPTDARVTIVSMTPAGRKIAEQLAGAVTAQLEELVGQATSARRNFIVRLAASVVEIRSVDRSSDGTT
jgi:DNA-binding MarR family transcriptional regulator